MATIRSFDKPFELVDYTEELLIVPNTWGLVNELGVFEPEGVAQHSITVEKIDQSLALITDRVRGERNNMNKDDNRELHSFAIPHFPLDDYIKPEDMQGKRAYGSADAEEQLAQVRGRKLARIRRNHAVTLEAARMQALTAGTVYAPNNTVVTDWYSSFGITQKSVDYVLGTGTTNIIGKNEEVIAHIQDNVLNGDIVTSIVALCSPEFFSKLINNASVKEAYKYYASLQEPARNRLGSGLYREFDHAGIRYIEYRGSYNGNKLIPANDAVFMPLGVTDMFKTYFSPANKFSFVNTTGEEAYVFEYPSDRDEEIVLQSESNFVNMLRRPQVVVKGTTSN
jgi:hypothetical protein